VLRLLPDEPQSMLGLAEIHLSNSHFERAISMLRTAVKTHPGVARFHKLLGDALTGTKDFKAALEAYNAAGGLCIEVNHPVCRPTWPEPRQTARGHPGADV
jgi:Flp pilus assembly protein TadD